MNHPKPNRGRVSDYLIQTQHQRRKKVRLLIPNKITVVLMGCLILMGCESQLDDNGISGIDRRSHSGYLRKDSLMVSAVTHAKSFMDSISTGNAQRLYLGQNSQYRFRMLFYFTLPRTVDSVIVKFGARFRLVSAGSYGSGVWTATVHPILRQWDENDLRWNRFEPNRDYGPAFAQFPVSSADTQSTVINIDMPRDTIQHWVWALTDTTRKQYGILIDFSPSASHVHQFYGGGTTVATSTVTPNGDLAPQLIFHWQKVNKKGDWIQDSTTVYPVTLKSGFSSFSGGRQGYVYSENAPLPANELWFGSGIPYHAFLRFSTDSLSKYATISRAVLIMRLDTTAGDYSRLTQKKVQVVRTETDPTEWQAGQIKLHPDDSYYIQFDTDQKRWLTSITNSDTLQFNITELLQSWVRRPESNKGLQIFNAEELKGNFNDIYRLRIFMHPDHPERSPKIIIYYTIPPDNE